MKDSHLVERCLAGDQTACKSLFDQYASPMLALCQRYISVQEDAEDALQEGFIRIFQHLADWNSSGPLGAWIRRIMVNVCLTKIKTLANKISSSSNENIPEVACDAEIHHELHYSDIESIMKNMPMGYKTVFCLVAIEGYSYPEVSSMLSITESTCRSQYFKAKNYLANKINTQFPSLKYTV